MTNIPIIRELEQLIIEHGSAVIQAKHIGLLKEQISRLEKQNENLQRENARLSEDFAKTKHELDRHITPSGYVDWEGVLIKRLPGGGYSDSPCCPVCKLPMSAMPKMAGGLFHCNPCDYVSRVSTFGFRNHLSNMRNSE